MPFGAASRGACGCKGPHQQRDILSDRRLLHCFTRPLSFPGFVRMYLLGVLYISRLGSELTSHGTSAMSLLRLGHDSPVYRGACISTASVHICRSSQCVHQLELWWDIGHILLRIESTYRSGTSQKWLTSSTIIGY